MLDEFKMKFEVGEEVVVDTHYNFYAAKIDYITKAGNYKIGDNIFNKDGQMRGDTSFHPTHICKMSDTWRAKLKRKELKFKVSNYFNSDKSKCISNEKLERILAILEEKENEWFY